MSLNPSKDLFSFLTTKVFDKALGKVKLWSQQKSLVDDSGDDISLTTGFVDDEQLVLSTLGLDTQHSTLKVPWWSWLTILSLDAPTVAVLWQVLLANSFDFMLKPLHSILLFVTVWLIYVVDRCFDSFVIAKAYTVRHDFYKRYIRAISVLVVLFVGIVLFVVVRWLEPTIILHGLLLAGVVLVYLANLHLLKKPFLLIPKELQIGFVFAIGTTITFWSQLNSLNMSQIILFWITTLCFAFICFLNCSFISLWEKSVDVLHQQPSLARMTIDTQRLAFILQIAALSLVVVSLCLPFGLALKLALVLSGLGLWFLQTIRMHVSVKLRRVLADVVLMAPLISLLFQNV